MAKEKQSKPKEYDASKGSNVRDDDLVVYPEEEMNVPVEKKAK